MQHFFCQSGGGTKLPPYLTIWNWSKCSACVLLCSWTHNTSFRTNWLLHYSKPPTFVAKNHLCTSDDSFAPLPWLFAQWQFVFWPSLHRFCSFICPAFTFLTFPLAQFFPSCTTIIPFLGDNYSVLARQFFLADNHSLLAQSLTLLLPSQFYFSPVHSCLSIDPKMYVWKRSGKIRKVNNRNTANW